MHRLLTALLISALLITGAAVSAEVTISTPQDGDVVGPSTPIHGQCSQRAFLVVVTDVLASDGRNVGMVPGIRHWTNDDNSISVRIATPRISFGEKEEPVTYVIHVRAYTALDLVESGQAPDVGEVEIKVKSG